MIKDNFSLNNSVYNKFQLSDEQRKVLEKSVFDKHEEEIKQSFSDILGIKDFERESTITHDGLKKLIKDFRTPKRYDYYDSHVGFNGL